MKKHVYIKAVIGIYFFYFSTGYAIMSWKKMNILIVVPTFPKIHDVCMLNQITGLIKRGHDVTIFAEHRGDTTKMQADVMAYRLLEKTIYEQLPANLDKFDIIMFQLGHKARDVKRTHQYKGKVVICLRGYDITGFLRQNPHWYDPYLKTCDLFLPVCEGFKKILRTIGCNPAKIIVQHSAIDCSRFFFKQRTIPSDGTLNVISSGRFVEKKGFEFAIRAIANLLKKYPKIQYTIIGEGELGEKFRALIREYNVQNNIRLEGWHPHDEYIKILDKADIFLFPGVIAANNDQEGISNVIKEAMAMGLLVVATNHSGNAELLKNGEYGFLIDERNIRSIQSVLEYILSHPDKWGSMRLAARRRIDAKFDLEKENDRLEKILLKVIS